MALSGVKHTFNRRLYVNQAREATFGTAAAATHIFYPTFDSSVLIPQIGNITDEGVANGAEFMTLQLPVDRSLPGTLKMWASIESIALFGAYVFGDDAVSGSGLDVVHTISMAAITGASLGSFTLQHQLDATKSTVSDWLHAGVVAQSLEISCARDGFITMSVGILGAGVVDDPATVTETGLTGYGETKFIPCGKVRVSTASGTAAASYTAPIAAGTWVNSLGTVLGQAVDSWNFRYENVLDANRMMGSLTGAGVHGGDPIIMRRNVSLDITTIVDANTYGWIEGLNNQSGASQLNYGFSLEAVTDNGLTNKYAGFRILTPSMTLAENPSQSSDRGIARQTMKWVAKKGASVNPAYLYVSGGAGTVYNA